MTTSLLLGVLLPYSLTFQVSNHRHCMSCCPPAVVISTSSTTCFSLHTFNLVSLDFLNNSSYFYTSISDAIIWPMNLLGIRILACLSSSCNSVPFCGCSQHCLAFFNLTGVICSDISFIFFRRFLYLCQNFVSPCHSKSSRLQL